MAGIAQSNVSLTTKLEEILGKTNDYVYKKIALRRLVSGRRENETLFVSLFGSTPLVTHIPTANCTKTYVCNFEIIVFINCISYLSRSFNGAAALTFHTCPLFK